MTYARISSLFVFCCLFVTMFMLTAGTTYGQDTLLISYQGRLTDDTGEPVNGTPSMTFTIYDAGGVSKWTETHPSVSVNAGLFSVNLGSMTALPDSVFTGEYRYLGVAVDGDPEMTPRSLLTSSPGAAVARRVTGDMTTAPGLIQLHPPEPCHPPDPCSPAIELSSLAGDNQITVNWGLPPDDQRTGLELGTDANSNFMRVNWAIPPNDIMPAFEVVSDALSQSVNMRLAMPPDDQLPEFEVSLSALNETAQMGIPPNDQMPGFMVSSDGATQTISAKLALPPDDQKPEIELFADEHENSIKVGFATPPDDQEPALKLSATDIANIFKVNWSLPPDDIRPGLEMGTDANSNFMRVNWGVPPNDIVPAFEVVSDVVGEEIEMRLGIPPDDIMPEIGFSVTSAVTAFNMNSPTGDLNPDLQILTSGEAGLSINTYDDVGKTMGVEPTPFNEGYGISLYDPTQATETELLALSAYYGDSIMGRIQMFHPLAVNPTNPEIEMVTTENGSRFKLGEASPDMGTSGIEMTSSDNAASIVLGSGPGAPSSVVTISTDATEARVGIGTETPSEILTVGDDLTYFSGNLITVGDADPTSYAGISFGQNGDNRGWLAYDNEDDYLYMGTKENGVFAPNRICIKNGDFGIGTAAPNYDLDVRGTIGNNTTLYHSDRRW